MDVRVRPPLFAVEEVVDEVAFDGTRRFWEAYCACCCAVLYVEGVMLGCIPFDPPLGLCGSVGYCDGGCCCCCCELLYDARPGTGFRCGRCCCCCGFIIMVVDIAPLSFVPTGFQQCAEKELTPVLIYKRTEERHCSRACNPDPMGQKIVSGYKIM